MKLTSTIPMLVVESIEDCLPFYQRTLDYAVKYELKDDQGKLTYLCVVQDKQTVMMESKAFLKNDLPDSVVKHLMAPGASFLYHSVEKLDMEQLKGQKGATVLHGPREASYGATEVFVLDAGGQVHGFGEWKKMEGA